MNIAKPTLGLAIRLLGFFCPVALLVGLPRRALFCGLMLAAIATFASGEVLLGLGFVCGLSQPLHVARTIFATVHKRLLVVDVITTAPA